jgi:hypothetical protein
MNSTETRGITDRIIIKLVNAQYGTSERRLEASIFRVTRHNYTYTNMFSNNYLRIITEPDHKTTPARSHIIGKVHKVN